MAQYKRIILLIALAALAACSMLPSILPPEATTDPQLTQNTQKWNAQKITHYRMSLSVGNIEVIRNRIPLMIEIDHGKVVSVLDNQGHPAPDLETLAEEFAGMDKLFDFVDHSIKTGAAQVEVTYDPTYGYPRSIYVDRSRQVPDDEFTLTIDWFEVLK